MVRQKTISLDEKTAIIAGRIPNFSRWVRIQLLNHARNAPSTPDNAIDYAKHVASFEARIWGVMHDKCNPRHKDGLCETCYPDGVDA